MRDMTKRSWSGLGREKGEPGENGNKVEPTFNTGRCSVSANKTDNESFSVRNGPSCKIDKSHTPEIHAPFSQGELKRSNFQVSRNKGRTGVYRWIDGIVQRPALGITLPAVYPSVG
ncbi:uncharacterized protein LOC143148583 [Ptiloglossa arizonensis]|uniref:uncharacterized protein LOC143148583 n=1 Tax=Ptiloglossa arizonensis TaxID=3350558 RepID=UPI003FA15902